MRLFELFGGCCMSCHYVSDGFSKFIKIRSIFCEIGLSFPWCSLFYFEENMTCVRLILFSSYILPIRLICVLKRAVCLCIHVVFWKPAAFSRSSKVWLCWFGSQLSVALLPSILAVVPIPPSPPPPASLSRRILTAFTILMRYLLLDFPLFPAAPN